MQEFFSTPQESVLCVNVGSRTQDVLIYQQGVDPQAMPRCVLPSPARTLARRIMAYTAVRRDIYLSGPGMGTGYVRALSAHIKEGCRAAVSEDIALALHENVAAAEEAGLQIVDACPDGYLSLRTGDVNLSMWREFCGVTGLDMPGLVAVAAQDHGYHPQDSGRQARMRMWQNFLYTAPGEGGDPPTWIVMAVPPEMARLAAIQSVTGGPVADSGAAALLGLLSVTEIAERSFRQGVLLVNAGNSHVSAFLVYRQRIFGVYEQHTLGISVDNLIKDLSEFRLGWLPSEQVQNEGGHGTVIIDLPPEAEGFRPAYVAGAQRRLLTGHGQMTAPHDEPMMTGCFGLLHGLGYI